MDCQAQICTFVFWIFGFVSKASTQNDTYAYLQWMYCKGSKEHLHAVSLYIFFILDQWSE